VGWRSRTNSAVEVLRGCDITGCKRVAEVREENAAVVVMVVPAHPQVHVLFVDVNAMDSQCVNYLWPGSPARRLHVNQLEGVVKVEIGIPS
jgi:hypothetical protein